MATGVTEKLAAPTSRVRYEDIPAEAIEKAKDCILDQVGVELIGSTLEWNKIAYRYVADMGGRVPWFTDASRIGSIRDQQRGQG